MSIAAAEPPGDQKLLPPLLAPGDAEFSAPAPAVRSQGRAGCVLSSREVSCSTAVPGCSSQGLGPALAEDGGTGKEVTPPVARLRSHGLGGGAAPEEANTYLD